MKSFASIATLDHISGYLSQSWDPIIFSNGCHCEAYSLIHNAKVSIHYQFFTEQCKVRQINWVFFESDHDKDTLHFHFSAGPVVC